MSEDKDPISRAIENDRTLGCGGELFHTGKDDPFFAACAAHDAAYDAHHAGDTTNTLGQVNQNFFDMIDQIIAAHGSPFWLRVRGALYKQIVRWVGDEYWNNKPRKKELLK